jgi:hypothetical protein
MHGQNGTVQDLARQVQQDLASGGLVSPVRLKKRHTHFNIPYPLEFIIFTISVACWKDGMATNKVTTDKFDEEHAIEIDRSGIGKCTVNIQVLPVSKTDVPVFRIFVIFVNNNGPKDNKDLDSDYDDDDTMDMTNNVESLFEALICAHPSLNNESSPKEIIETVLSASAAETNRPDLVGMCHGFMNQS